MNKDNSLFQILQKKKVNHRPQVKTYMPFYFDDVYPRFFFPLGRSPSAAIRADLLAR